MKVISIYEAGVFDEQDVYHEGKEITLTFTDGEIADLLAVYDPASSTSPSVSYCRPIVKGLLDAILARG
jgi:hypothetical protein